MRLVLVLSVVILNALYLKRSVSVRPHGISRANFNKQVKGAVPEQKITHVVASQLESNLEIGVLNVLGVPAAAAQKSRFDDIFLFQYH